jgi:pimeloyl-ACP methyl ester carboxylesterase
MLALSDHHPHCVAIASRRATSNSTASKVLDTVKQVISAYGTSTVTTVGQSLGAALALIDSVFLRLQLPATISVNYVGYGLLRVGNQAWADLVDAQLPAGNVVHINNQKDPVPIVLPLSLGYHHPSGEIHIQESGDWVACSGQDNPSDLCIVGAVPSIFSGNIVNHNGPYNGIICEC